MRTALTVVDVLAGTSCLVLAVAAYRRRRGTPGAGPLVALLLGLALWSLGGAYVTSAPVGDGALLVARHLAEASTVLLSVAYWFVVASVVDPTRRPAPLARTLVVVPAVLAVLALATNPWHEQYLALDAHHVRPGPAYWAAALAGYVVSSLAVARAFAALSSAGPFRRRQLRVVLLGALPTLVSSTAGVVWAVTRDDGDLVARLGIGPTAALVSIAVFRHEVAGLVTVARDHVFELLADPVVVADHTGLVIDLNPEGRALVARVAPDHADRPDLRLADLGLELPGTGPSGPAAGDGPPTDVRLHEVGTVGGVWLDVRARPLLDGGRRHVGWVLLLSDVTDTVLRSRRLQRSARELLTRTVDLSVANVRLSAELAAAEAERAQLDDDARHDALTGLHNRRVLAPAMHAAVDDARGGTGHASVVVLDVDHFKSVNDRYGHAVGDAVLRAVADGLAATARATDTVVRAGGEEFVLVLPGADHATAVRRADELRSLAGAAAADAGQPVTLSAGVATYPEHGEDADTLLDAADRALYAAKRAGRDRTAGARAPGDRSRV